MDIKKIDNIEFSNSDFVTQIVLLYRKQNEIVDYLNKIIINKKPISSICKIYSTKEVAKLLSLEISALSKAVWQGRIDAPEKSSSGSFLWTEKNIEQAAIVMKKR